jgi:hypothetical protein
MISYIVEFIIEGIFGAAVDAGTQKKKTIAGNIVRVICYLILLILLVLAFISFSDSDVKIF